MIRQLSDNDAARVEEIFRKQGFVYTLPRCADFLESVAIDDEGLQIAVAARPTVELYLFADPEWGTPGERNAALKFLHREMAARLRARGVQDAHMWVPPQLSRFTKRLVRNYGWELIGPEWPCLTRLTNV